MKTPAKRMKARTSGCGFEDRVRFNWGYHDAAAEAGRGRPRVCFPAGEHNPNRVSRAFDAAYHDGYKAGLEDFAASTYAGDSTAAWVRTR